MAQQDSLKANLIPRAGLAAFCLIVIWFGVPVFWNSLVAQRSIDTVLALRRGEPVDESRIRHALDAIGPIGGERWIRASGDRLVDQGILTLALAMSLPPGDDERIALLRQAIELAEARVAESPADTHSWARLAYASYYLNGPAAETFHALRMSYRTGLYERYLIRQRLELGILLWHLSDEDLKELTLQQALGVWNRFGWHRLEYYYFRMPEEAQQRFTALMRDHPHYDDFAAAVERSTRRR